MGRFNRTGGKKQPGSLVKGQRRVRRRARSVRFRTLPGRTANNVGAATPALGAGERTSNTSDPRVFGVR